MQEKEWSEKEHLRQHIKDLTKTISFFSPQRKQERELWVGKRFISFLGLNSKKQSLKLSEGEPPDLVFEGAQFELKEIMEDGRRRGDEYKSALKAAEKANCLDDLLEEYRPRSMTLCEAVLLVGQKAEGLQNKYSPAVTRSLDLLFYLNWQDYSIEEGDFNCGELNPTLSLWRSVSVVSNDCAFGLFAHKDAPEFLKATVLQLYR